MKLEGSDTCISSSIEREPGGCSTASLRLARVLWVESRVTFMLGKCPTLELVCEGRSKETADLMAAFLGGRFLL